MKTEAEKTTEETGVVIVQQLPKIKDFIKKRGLEVKKRLSDLGIDNIEATDENIKLIKNLKAELKGEINIYEGQRKTVKKAINKPYDEFNGLYEIEIKEEYKKAVAKLTEKQASIEVAVLEKKENEVLSYFNELCISENIEFLTFDKYKVSNKVKMQLSVTPKKYKEACNLFIQNIKSDLVLIETQEHKVEILAEYEQNLDCSTSITTIVDRKKREAEKAKAVKKAEWVRRATEIMKLGFKLSKDKTEYVHENNIDIIINWANVADIKKEEFETILDQNDIEIKSRIKPVELEIKEPKEVTLKDVIGAVAPEPIKEIFSGGGGGSFEMPAVKTPKAEPEPKKEILTAPTEVKEVEKIIVEFQVFDTLEKVKLLKTFMEENNINFKNI